MEARKVSITASGQAERPAKGHDSRSYLRRVVGDREHPLIISQTNRITAFSAKKRKLGGAVTGDILCH